MLKGILGTKIGMTQLFDKNGDVVPVSVIDVNNWVVTQIKSSAKDGYDSIQLGLMRKRYRTVPFSDEWLKMKKNHFLQVKEIKTNNVADFSLGQSIDLSKIDFKEGDVVAVTGTSKGLGFQGVVKRWGFAGGPAAHGSKFHRRPGTSGHLRRQGEIIKGKKFPGHAGAEQVTVKGLEIVRIDLTAGCVFVKGAIPGKKDSMVAINKLGI